MAVANNNLEKYLNQFSEQEWLTHLNTLLSAIHEVDRTAVQIWLRLFPLELRRYIAMAETPDNAVQALRLQGKYLLEDQVDRSHRFLYGHRFWKIVKAEIEAEATTFEGSDAGLNEEIKKIATTAARKAKAEVSLLIGITVVGLMTLAQVGLEDFTACAGDVEKPKGIMARSPDRIVAERQKDDSQGILGFLKTVNKQFSIIYDENRSDGRFPVMNDQPLTSASSADKSQDWQARDVRCWDGVIPIECTAASCGTCWVGVIGGQEKLSEVAPRERRAMKIFGYNQPEGPKPFLRLACQAKAFGNATIVIPPWNGLFGKKVYGNVEDRELEPVTTSAKALRKTVQKVAARGEE